MVNNRYTAVAYDKDNDHVLIAWNMTYSDILRTSKPIRYKVYQVMLMDGTPIIDVHQIICVDVLRTSKPSRHKVYQVMPIDGIQIIDFHQIMCVDVPRTSKPSRHKVYQVMPIDVMPIIDLHQIMCVDVTWNTSFPIGSFPAQVYANPDYNGSNDPSMQPIVFGICPYNSIDASLNNVPSNGSLQVAVSSHNTNELVYAWMDASYNIFTKVVLSGVAPRLNSNSLNKPTTICFPNPYNSESGNIQLNVNNYEIYELGLFNSLGEKLFEYNGNREEMEKRLTQALLKNSSGLYFIGLECTDHQILHDKVVFTK